MKIDELNKELQEKIVQMLNDAKPEEKADAIYKSVCMIAEAQHKDLIDELVEQNAKATADDDYRKALGLHKLSKEEETFYEKFKDIKQAITASQVDIMPTSIIDRTMDDVQKGVSNTVTRAVRTGRREEVGGSRALRSSGMGRTHRSD